MEMDSPGEYEARIKRIEAYHEASARDIAAISATQRDHTGDIAKLYKLTGEIAEGQKALQTAQQKSEKAMEYLAIAMADLAVAQKISQLAQAETQGKFDALIHMWDDWIGNRGDHPATRSTVQ